MRLGRWLAFTLMLTATIGGRAPAQSPTNDWATVMQNSDACVQRLREIYDEAAKMEEIAPSDDKVLIDCIHSHVMKIQGLLDAAGNIQTELQRVYKVNETASVEKYVENLKFSRERAEKLFVEAQECATSGSGKTIPPKAVVPVDGTNASASITVITPRAPEPLMPRRRVVRTEQTCLKQGDFAIMLARAMGLKLVEPATTDYCIKVLAKAAVEPLGSWQPGKCTTVDDAYVACARAMKLKVTNPQDPLSYGEALREAGLAVDTLLPERDPKLDPPLVLDAEVRALLTTGYAAPLPSAKRLSPD